MGMGRADTGFYISEDKTAIVYGFADGKESPLHVLISDDMGNRGITTTLQVQRVMTPSSSGLPTNKMDGSSPEVLQAWDAH